MNHDLIASMWAAHNTGLAFISQTIHRKGGFTHEKHMHVKSEARGSRLSFRGDTISSYHWWPFGQFATNEAGEKAVLFRSHRYSSSTGKHQNYARRALRTYADEVPVFDVHDDMDASHGERIKGYMQRVRDGFDLALRARTQAGRHIEHAGAEHDEMLAYARFFNVEIPAWANPFATPGEVGAMEAKLTELSIKTGIPINSFWRTA